MRNEVMAVGLQDLNRSLNSDLVALGLANWLVEPDGGTELFSSSFSGLLA